MALLSDLVRIVSVVEGLEEVSVGIFARHAREAGLISQGGRGRSAAKMTVKDAANLLIAVNGCHLAKEVPAIVPAIRQLTADEKNPQDTLIGIAKHGSKFGDDFERVISFFTKIDGSRQRADPPGETHIRFFRPTSMVYIEMNPSVGSSYREELVTYGGDQTEIDIDGPDRWDETVISHRTIRAIAEAL